MSNLKLNQNLKINQKIEKETMNLPIDRGRFAAGTTSTGDSIRQLQEVKIEVR